jgi:glycerol-3-phosphate acyltransferase PlsY
MVLKLVAAILLGYLLGAIPFGVVIIRLGRRVDVTKYGSGKIGATNVLRTGGVKAAAAVFALDIAKGAVAVVLARVIVGTQEATLGTLVLDFQSAQFAAALAAVVGHNWSIYIRFRGGRGVCTFFGGLFAMWWSVGLIGGALVIGLMALTRYASVGSMAGIAGSFLAMLLFLLLGRQPVEYLLYTGVAGGLILFQHRDNIQRICAGKERKMGEKAEEREPSVAHEIKG